MKRFLSFFANRLVRSPLLTGFGLFSTVWAFTSLWLAWYCPWSALAWLPARSILLTITLIIFGILIEFSNSFAIHAAARSLQGVGTFKRLWTDHLLASSLSVLVLWIWPWWRGAPGLFIAVWSGLIFIALRGVYQFNDRRALSAWLLSLPMQLVMLFLVGLLAVAAAGWRHRVWNTWIVKAENASAAGQPAQAEIYFGKALTLALKGGPQNADTARSWYEFGVFYQALGHDSDAEEALRHAAPILRQLYGVNSRPYWDCIVRLAEIAEQTGRYRQAEALYRDLLGTMEHELGSKHPFEIGYFNALARLAYIQERYSDAEMFYSRALVVAESIPADKPSSPNDFRITLVNSLAYTYAAEGKFDDLRRLLESHPGFDPPTVYQEKLWNQLKKLADTTAAHDPIYAEKLLQRCLIIARGMGPHDPHNRLTREALARIHLK